VAFRALQQFKTLASPLGAAVVRLKMAKNGCTFLPKKRKLKALGIEPRRASTTGR
jgi:hypothetical protein